MKKALGFGLIVLIASTPMQALACPVCMDDNEANRVAYIAMTALLTGLPFLIVGSLGFYIWKKSAQAENEGA